MCTLLFVFFRSQNKCNNFFLKKAVCTRIVKLKEGRYINDTNNIILSVRVNIYAHVHTKIHITVVHLLTSWKICAAGTYRDQQ